jgi:hypothetical protein
MADSTKNKSNLKPNRLDAELDALLDEAALSMTPQDHPQADEDVIDRLLLDAGFDVNEELPPAVDDSDFSTNDNDNFALADISTEIPAADENLAIVDDFAADLEFPLDLLNSVTKDDDSLSSSDFDTLNHDKDSNPAASALTDPAPNQSKNLLFDDKNDNLADLTDKLDEFSALDELNDFHELQENDGLDLASETILEQNQPPNEPLDTNHEIGSDDEESAEADIIIDTIEPEAIELSEDYDEFGDDLNDPYPIPLSTPSAKSSTVQSVNDEAEIFSADSANQRPITDEFDITAHSVDDFDPDTPESFDDEASDAEPSVNFEKPEPETFSQITTKPASAEKATETQDSSIEAASIPALLQFKSEQEALNKKQKKQISDYETQIKKASLTTYAALGFGVAAVISALVLGFVTYRAKSQINQLSALIVQLQAQKEPAMPASGEPPHEKAMANEAPPEGPASAEHSPIEHEPQAHESIAEAEPSAPPAATEHEAIVQAPTKPHHDSAHDDAEHSQTAHNNEVANHKPATEKPAATPTTSNQTAEHQPLETHDQQAPSANEHKAATPEALASISETTKAADSTPVLLEKELAPEPTNVNQAAIKKPSVVKKKSSKASHKTIATAKRPTTASSTNWSVNLIAYKQQWYANSKADEFIQKGVPVEVIPIKIKDITWYRLRVRGFDTKQEASSYAARVKKALNLTSVWVGN